MVKDICTSENSPMQFLAPAEKGKENRWRLLDLSGSRYTPGFCWRTSRTTFTPSKSQKQIFKC